MILSDRTLDSVATRFSAWKNRQPYCAAGDEIKGKDLSQLQQASFAHAIVLESDSLWLTLAGTKTNLFKREVAEEFIRNSAAVVRATAMWAQEHDKPRLTDFYRKMAHWLEERSPENVMWLYTLGSAIHLSIQHSIILFAEEKDDCEFENIEILIDKSFIEKPKHNDFWREWLRNFLFTRSEKEPVTVIKDWSERKHPFNRKYRRTSGVIDWSDLFRSNMHFVDSEKVLGVQIADICANICYRHYSGNRKYRPYRLLRSRVFGKDNTEMHYGILSASSLLTDSPENHVLPYADEDFAALAEGRAKSRT